MSFLVLHMTAANRFKKITRGANLGKATGRQPSSLGTCLRRYTVEEAVRALFLAAHTCKTFENDRAP